MMRHQRGEKVRSKPYELPVERQMQWRGNTVIEFVWPPRDPSVRRPVAVVQPIVMMPPRVMDARRYYRRGPDDRPVFSNPELLPSM